MVRTARMSEDPNAPPRRRQEGNPKKGFSFRAPDEIKTFLLKQRDVTDYILRAIILLRELEAAMGESFFDLKALSEKKGVHMAKFLAEWAKAGLEASEKKRK